MTPTRQNLVIIGAGGHGRELLDIVEAINAAHDTYEFLGFVDDGSPDLDRIGARGAKHLGPSGILKDLDVSYVIGVGDGSVRRRVARVAEDAGLHAATLVHPSATVGSAVKMGAGAILAAGARVTTNVTLGAHVHLNVNSVVSHDCAVHDFATLSPGALVNGGVTLKTGTFLGTAAVVTPGLTVGAWARVGAGAVVIRDVPEGDTVVGVPAGRVDE